MVWLVGVLWCVVVGWLVCCGVVCSKVGFGWCVVV